MKRPSVQEIIAKGLPFVKGMREMVAQDIYDEIVATGYRIAFVEPDIPRVPSAGLAHVRKRNNERREEQQ